MYQLDYTGKFKKDVKTCEKRGYDLSALRTVIKHLEEEGQVPAEYLPHKLVGKLRGYWECHIETNWLLIYDVQETVKLVSLARTGNQVKLFQLIIFGTLAASRRIRLMQQ